MMHSMNNISVYLGLKLESSHTIRYTHYTHDYWIYIITFYNTSASTCTNTLPWQQVSSTTIGHSWLGQSLAMWQSISHSVNCMHPCPSYILFCFWRERSWKKLKLAYHVLGKFLILGKNDEKLVIPFIYSSLSAP